MPEKRKDPKGRVLKDGESYRKSDNLYTLQIPLNRRTDSADCGVSIPM